MTVKTMIRHEDFANSLFLHERYQVLSNNKDLVWNHKDLLNVNKWKEDLYKGKENNFSKRLQYDGYNEEIFEALISPIKEGGARLYRGPLFKNINFSLLKLGLEILKSKDLNEEEYQLVEFIYPFIVYASANLIETVPLRLKSVPFHLENIKQKLLLSLAEELLNIASRSIILELNVSKLREELVGETPEDRFKSFVIQKARNIDSLLEFYKEYAVLTRFLITRTDYFLENIQSLLVRLEKDWPTLKSEFGIDSEALLEINIGQGDTHQKGNTVIKLVFEDGKEMMYKPKPLAIASAFNQFIKWIASERETLSLPTYKIIDSGEYGWEERITPKGCISKEEVSRFYFRFGSLAGLMYLLNGADMHFENLIAHGEYPYLIDLETIFHQYPKLDFPDSSEIKLKYKQADSVIGTGLLPQTLFQNSDGKGLDFSALNGKEQVLPFKVLSLDQVNTDNMVYSLKAAKSQGASNLPSLNGVPVQPHDYLSDIVAGFQDMMQFFLENKERIVRDDGPLSLFKGLKIRIVARATQQYSHFLLESTHPDYMRDAIYLEKLFERMWYYPYLDKRIVKHEVRDLLQRDVPYFATFVDSCHLYNSHGEQIPDFFQESGYQKVINKIKNLTIEEKEDQTNWLILSIEGNRDANFEIKKAKAHNLSPKPFNYKESFLEEAKKIGDILVEKATFSDDKQNASWLNVNILNDHWFVSPMKQSLYDGLSGVALFLLYLQKETNEDRYLETAHAAMQSAMHPFVHSKGLVSTFFGDLSVIYALLHFQKLSPKDEYRAFVEKAKSALRQRVDEDLEFDLLSGSAGIVHLLLNLYEFTEDTEYLEIMHLYCQHLIQHAHDTLGGIAWKNRHTQTYLGGLSHGASGIATALWRAGGVTGHEDYRYFAEQAVLYDRSLFNPNKKAWIDLRKEREQYLHQWTHGSTGIGISRLLMKKYRDDPLFDWEVRTAISNVESFGFKNNNNLCHGNMGDTELYLLASKQYQDDGLLWKARYIGKQVIATINDTKKYQVDSPSNVESLGLFVGISGIGLQLLRLRNPNSIPSILTLENA
ncbi:type 2 lantibiotic biosynthesis protein LanM [Oikeobacillus pervagus]|uniref:Type 2 lantibiotic biosynthesis protein LanM n=1 Tax=Oikeobacillus pervagus TaxID=1325931 RepID=A0AAJ1T0I7_9BACI|nr:type 2 lanthipeptide synthetase LanM family protein [Oikeobacillus pervagus]MDQ0216370.1 type 2 lantibiotic biosynthesis protein LanM [Oikeobacillus pervagus]